MEKHFALLGFKVRDVVTGFEGVVATITLDLYGCIQAIVSPPINEKGEIPDGRWFDVKRLVAISDVPVMTVPWFETIAVGAEAGGAEKPPFPSNPVR